MNDEMKGAKMVTATYIAAPNDKNGNPRRGWLVLFCIGEDFYRQFFDEGYSGSGAIPSEIRDDVVRFSCEINVSASEYNSTCRHYEQKRQIKGVI